MDAEQTREAYPAAASGWDTRNDERITENDLAVMADWDKRTEKKRIIPPSTIGESSLSEIIKALSRPLPDSLTDTRKQGGATLKYIPWHNVNKILDKYAPGWNWSIVKLELSSDRIFLIGRLSIPTSEGLVYREATGTEQLKEDKQVWIGEKPNQQPLKDEFGRIITEKKELAYGDPSSNAESMAFRRAATRFGLGLYLYDK